MGQNHKNIITVIKIIPDLILPKLQIKINHIKTNKLYHIARSAKLNNLFRLSNFTGTKIWES